MSTKKRITELTVVELRTQLGKRGVDTTGDRPALIGKLKKALQVESAKNQDVTSTSTVSCKSGYQKQAHSVSTGNGEPQSIETQKKTGERVDFAVIGKVDVEQASAGKPLVLQPDDGEPGLQAVCLANLTELASATVVSVKSSVSSYIIPSSNSFNAVSVKQLLPMQQESISSTLTTADPVSIACNSALVLPTSSDLNVSIPSVAANHIVPGHTVPTLEQKVTSGTISPCTGRSAKITPVNTSILAPHNVAIVEETGPTEFRGSMKVEEPLLLADTSVTDIGTLVVASTSSVSKESFEMDCEAIVVTSVPCLVENSDTSSSMEAMPTSEIDLKVQIMSVVSNKAPTPSDFGETCYQASVVDLPTKCVSQETTTGDSSASASKKTSSTGSAGVTAADTSGHVLWISGLIASYRAADLKLLFSKYGKVTGAKVVTSAKNPGSQCFGFVTMSSTEEAEFAIQNINGTEIATGRKITVEKDKQRRAILQSPSSTVLSQTTSTSTTLWVNGLSNTIKAADLKLLFFKHGKVIGAKVVTSAKNPGSKCYGLVTLATAEEAEHCITQLNKTEFNGRIISLEKAKPDVKTQVKVIHLPETHGLSSTAEQARKLSVGLVADTEETVSLNATKLSNDNKYSFKPRDNLDEKILDRPPKVLENEETKSSNKDRKDDSILSLNKIKEERERERRMLKERAAREEERRRLRELEQERKLHREEAERLARERERLRQEKLAIEKERAEAERARADLERERLRHERRERDRERERVRQRLDNQRREVHEYTPQQQSSLRNDIKRSGTLQTDGPYWAAPKRPLIEGDLSAYNFSSRETERASGPVHPLLSGYRVHESVAQQRSSLVEQQCFNTLSRNEPYEIRAGMSGTQWQSTSGYRIADSAGFGAMPGAGEMDSSRSSYAGSSATSGSTYFPPSGQQYKWF